MDGEGGAPDLKPHPSSRIATAPLNPERESDMPTEIATCNKITCSPLATVRVAT